MKQFFLFAVAAVLAVLLSYCIANAHTYQSGCEVRIGDRKANVLTGRKSCDVIIGNRGDDLIQGQGGADYLDGGKGDDIIYGGIRNDIILTGKGNDIVYAGRGRDTIIFSTNERHKPRERRRTKVVYGGSGKDTVIFNFPCKKIRSLTNCSVQDFWKNTYIFPDCDVEIWQFTDCVMQED